MGTPERGLGKFKEAYLATRILFILVNWGVAILEMDMERVEEGSIDVGSSWEGGGGKIIRVDWPGIGSSQEVVLEDAQTLEFSDVFINP